MLRESPDIKADDLIYGCCSRWQHLMEGRQSILKGHSLIDFVTKRDEMNPFKVEVERGNYLSGNLK
jgi:hypothetical protein